MMTMFWVCRLSGVSVLILVCNDANCLGQPSMDSDNPRSTKRKLGAISSPEHPPAKRQRRLALTDLPAELFVNGILKHLSAGELMRYSLVNKHFHRMVKPMIMGRLELNVQLTTQSSLSGIKAIKITTSSGLRFQTPNYGYPSDGRPRLRRFLINQPIPLGSLVVLKRDLPMELRVSILAELLPSTRYSKYWHNVGNLPVGTRHIQVRSATRFKFLLNP